MADGQNQKWRCEVCGTTEDIRVCPIMTGDRFGEEPKHPVCGACFFAWHQGGGRTPEAIMEWRRQHPGRVSRGVLGGKNVDEVARTADRATDLPAVGVRDGVGDHDVARRDRSLATVLGVPGKGEPNCGACGHSYLSHEADRGCMFVGCNCLRTRATPQAEELRNVTSELNAMNANYGYKQQECDSLRAENEKLRAALAKAEKARDDWWLNLHSASSKLAKAVGALELCNATLHNLNRRGGLGIDAHATITTAEKVSDTALAAIKEVGP